jgi:hypothetical protein
LLFVAIAVVPEGIKASACGRREVAAVQTIENKNKNFREASCAVAKRIWLVAIAGRKEWKRDADADWGYQRMRCDAITNKCRPQPRSS